ncbi:hypothetical protein N0V90_013374 [Kalmusia sp. IMI 367209]|nr:hypothetical protein N0V90_013374 [Kalmusia sp. IMI 367209]
MASGNVDVHARFVNALRTQAKALPPSDALPCPYCSHQGRIFQNLDQLFSHAKTDHAHLLQDIDQSRARSRVKEDALKVKATADRVGEATAGGGSTPDITTLSLFETGKGRQSPYGKKRPAEFHARCGTDPGSAEIYDSDWSRVIPHTIVPERPRPNPRLFDHSKGTTSPYRSTQEPCSEWSVEANRSQFQPSRPINPPSPLSQLPNRGPQAYRTKPQGPSSQRQTVLTEVQHVDSRYSGLLLQPDSRPISQEQLASEVKSIYAGLTMVETKCIHADRAQESQAQNSAVADSNWQALIALHRTLLHEHHDFFLASQHPSASPALRRLASKYAIPARMWKHGIHSFLELLRRRLPENIDYMLAFIYLAYQMMALLYESVPQFEDTWIECLGDLGRYRMAIEDEDLRDRELWAGVARSWYNKAADKSPSVGRLCHHLAILARPHSLQQLDYYARSLSCVKPFPSARESILTLLDPILGRPTASHALPIDISFIQAHSVLFEKLSLAAFEEAAIAFQRQLDNPIGRVTAKWKEQGVYIAITNISKLFNHSAHNSALILLAKSDSRNRNSSQLSSPAEEEPSQSFSPADSSLPIITETKLPSKLDISADDFTFSKAYLLAMSTLSLVHKRTGDKNVLPHVHVLLSFLASFAPIQYASHLVDDTPWSAVVIFSNTLLKAERPKLMEGPVFPNGQPDNLPLPEDYLIRGQLWSQWYFQENWFADGHDEKERYFELVSTIKSRTKRILQRIAILTQSNALQKLYEPARSFALKISSLSTKRRHNASLGFMSMPLALNMLVPGAAAQSADTATNPNWRQPATDTLSDILVASAVLVAPMIILVIFVGLAAALLWAEAEGTLGVFMLITAIIFTAIRPNADSTTKESDRYVRLAVGLGYLMLMLAYCRVVVMQPKHKKASNSERKSRNHSRIFCTIAVLLSIIIAIIFMALPGSSEHWKSLTGLSPILALSLTMPLSFFLCDLVLNIARAVNRHEEKEEETARFSELSQVEASGSTAFDLQDMSMGRFRNLYVDSDAEEINSIWISDNESSGTQRKAPLAKRFGAWILGVFRKRKAA